MSVMFLVGSAQVTLPIVRSVYDLYNAEKGNMVSKRVGLKYRKHQLRAACGILFSSNMSTFTGL